jgi:glycosyltransferase involved in cell wall biosynthesis
MIVGNDITTDTRVQKSASCLARAGLRVTIVGYAPAGELTRTSLGECQIVRVPVTYALRDARGAARKRRRQATLRVGYRTPVYERRARLRVQTGQRAVTAASGRALRSSGSTTAMSYRLGVAARRVKRVLLQGQITVVRGRVGLQRRIDKARVRAWGRWDRRVAGIATAAPWRSVVPEIDDFELAFGPVIDGLEPDVVHAHDFHMVGIASGVVARARLRGRKLSWVYDAHEFVHGLPRYGGRTKRTVAAYEDLEREYIADADWVITVSEPIAEELERRYALPRRPDVVMNIPAVAPADVGGERPTLRAACGLEAEVPLIVYSGGVTPARGVGTIVEALPLLPEVHFALVAVPAKISPFVQTLLDRANEIGVIDRVHLVAPTASAEVVTFLESATVGVHPMVRDFEGHDMALPNKLFEYLYAGLPVVVSDCRVMADFVRRARMGEVFPSGDPALLAEAVTRVLADRERYVSGTHRDEVLAHYTWARQEQILRDVYRDLLGRDALLAESQIEPYRPMSEVATEMSAAGRVSLLGIGPANMAGQAWAWAKAVERHVGVATEVVAVRKERLNFTADELVTAETFARDKTWQRCIALRATGSWTHALLEAGRPVLGRLNGDDFTGDVDVLRRHGVQVALVFHGSEIRNPRAHAERHRWSPFADPADELTARLQRQVDVLAPRVRAFDGPVYVSTPDLLDDLPGATWLPVVVDTAQWTPGGLPLERRVPTVLHAPSNTALKGTSAVEEVVTRLTDRGLFEYRRLEEVPPADMPALIREADIVLDQYSIGSYGVLAAQAMAAGRVTIGHVHQTIRDRTPADIPIIEATLDTLEAVLLQVLDDRARARESAAAGVSFVAELHDGRRSAAVLADFLATKAT